MPDGMFVKRAGKVLKALYGAANPVTFTAVSSITDPVIADENPEDLVRTLKIMSDQQYVEVETDASGNQSYKLTASGVVMAGLFYQEAN